jgi:hypothetical protein
LRLDFAGLHFKKVLCTKSFGRIFEKKKKNRKRKRDYCSLNMADTTASVPDSPSSHCRDTGSSWWPLQGIRSLWQQPQDHQTFLVVIVRAAKHCGYHGAARSSCQQLQGCQTIMAAIVRSPEVHGSHHGAAIH